MVTNGFSFLEVRKMYIDELFEYYKFVFFHLENKGEVKQGTYEKLENNGAEDTVAKLKQQLFKATANKKK